MTRWSFVFDWFVEFTRRPSIPIIPPLPLQFPMIDLFFLFVICWLFCCVLWHSTEDCCTSCKILCGILWNFGINSPFILIFFCVPFIFFFFSLSVVNFKIKRFLCYLSVILKVYISPISFFPSLFLSLSLSLSLYLSLSLFYKSSLAVA